MPRSPRGSAWGRNGRRIWSGSHFCHSDAACIVTVCADAEKECHETEPGLTKRAFHTLRKSPARHIALLITHLVQHAPEQHGCTVRRSRSFNATPSHG